MELSFGKGPRRNGGLDAALLGALWLTALGTLDRLDLLPWCLPGALLPALLPLASAKSGRTMTVALLILGMAGLFPAWNGILVLANQIFSRSQEAQAYEYVYFAAVGEDARLAALVLSLLAGLACSVWGGWALGALGLSLGLAMAYFGLSPEPAYWLLPAILGTWRCLPWLRAGQMAGAAALVLALCLLAMALSPEPDPRISALDDRIRDALAQAGVSYDPTPVPTQVPAPETVPPPLTEEEQPDRAVQPWTGKVLFFVLAGLTLAVLFIPAVIRDRAEKRRRANRSGLDDPDNAAAIRALCLYARRWRTFAQEAVPQKVTALYLEAAYSGHAMTEDQRAEAKAYVRRTAEAVWRQANWWKKLWVQYFLAL